MHFYIESSNGQASECTSLVHCIWCSKTNCLAIGIQFIVHIAVNLARLENRVQFIAQAQGRVNLAWLDIRVEFIACGLVSLA